MFRIIHRSPRVGLSPSMMHAGRDAVTVAFLLACSVSAIGCQEDMHSRYATLAELEVAGPGARTWFPEILPESASHLEVWYNIDTNDTVGPLRFERSEVERFRRRLASQQASGAFGQANLRMLGVSDWPRCLRGAVSESDVRSCGYDAVRVRGFHLVIDPGGSLYFWTPP